MGLWTLLACGGDTVTNVADSDTASTTSTDCWWCVDTGPAVDDTGGATQETADTGKDGEDTEDTDKGGEEILSAKLSPVTGLGSLDFTAYDPDAYCDLSIDVDDATATETCTDCTLAYQLTLADAAEISKDGGGCDPGLAYQGTVQWWGNGTAGVLWSSSDGEIWSAETGSSSKVAGGSWSWSLDL